MNRFELGLRAIVPTLDPAAQAAQDLPRDRADRARHLAYLDAVMALGAEEDDLVAWVGLDVGDVEHQHVHADRANHGRTAAADEGDASAFETRVEAVGITGRHDGDPSRPFGDEAGTIADDLARSDVLHSDEPA